METKRDLTVLVSSTLILSAMTSDELDKFPVGAVVYLATYKEVLMTVISRSVDGVTVAWFDKNNELHAETLPAAALKVRTANPSD